VRHLKHGLHTLKSRDFTLKRGGRERKSFNRKERPMMVAMLQCWTVGVKVILQSTRKKKCFKSNPAIFFHKTLRSEITKNNIEKSRLERTLNLMLLSFCNLFRIRVFAQEYGYERVECVLHVAFRIIHKDGILRHHVQLLQGVWMLGICYVPYMMCTGESRMTENQKNNSTHQHLS